MDARGPRWHLVAALVLAAAVAVALQAQTPTAVRAPGAVAAGVTVTGTIFDQDAQQDVTVSNSNAQVDTSGGGNQDAVTIDQGLLDALPIFDQDLIGTVSRFLDAGATGNGGVTIVVNGMEVSALNVSASAVQ